MQCIEAIKEYNLNEVEKSIFLAGGITNCPNWQKYVVEQLSDTQLVIFNPRRESFPIHDPNASFEQIKWEYTYLRKSDMISFWFCKETLCPIVLYELGSWNMTNKKLFIGIEPNYKRKKDVEIQTHLARPDIEIVYDLDILIQNIRKEGR